MFFVALATSLAHGETAAPLTSHVPHGYVFDQPRILAQQRLFGLAHGISLLADACFDRLAQDDGSETRLAYAAWQRRQAAAIALAREELVRYYFGARAGEAAWSDIVAALGLKNELPLPAGSKKLAAACATLPQALAREHNDLAAQFRLQTGLARLSRAAEIEAQAQACLRLSPDDTALQAGIETWRQTHGAVVDEARQAVEARWQKAGLDGSLEPWLKPAREHGSKKADSAGCQGWAAWLATPEADPDHAFNQRP